MKNYYDILEVSRKASKDTINKVFKMHMKANHPDLFQGDDKIKAEEKSKELTEAYNTLSDDNERAKYDAELEAEESASQSNPQIEAILQENEYLKQVIAKKDAVITRLTGNDYSEPQAYGQNNNYYNNNGYQNNNGYNTQYNQGPGYGTGFNGFTPPQTDPYANMSAEELKDLKRQETKNYYMGVLKEFGIRVLVLGIILLVLIISLWSSFRDMANLWGR